MKKLVLVLFALTALGIFLTGCSSTNDPVDTSSDLEDFGSYKATPEEPYFGDPDVAEVAESETETYDDPLADSPEAQMLMDSTENSDEPAIYLLRVVWGNLEQDSGVVDLTEWSGKLTLSRGAILATHTILFEPGQDYLLPRYDSTGNVIPEELGWVSQTSFHYDGVRTKLFIPPSMTDDIVTLTYESQQLSITFDINELDELDTLINIGFGNAISFHAIRWEKQEIHHGGLVGRWGRDENGEGIFYGKWMSANGSLMGTIMGNWGVDSAGQSVFVGKYIDNDGNFEGFVRGYYKASPSPHANPRASGRFWGLIYNADREPIGRLKGHFKKGDHRRSGYFAGRWCTDCDIPGNFSPFDTF